MTDEKTIAERIGAAEAAIAQMRMDTQMGQEMREAEVDHLFGGEPPLVPIGGDGGGGMFAWDETQKKIGSGMVMVGRSCVGVEGTAANTGDGTYMIEVDMETATASVVATSGWTRSDDEKAYIPLYVIANGVIQTDMRGMFCVQRWED